MKNPEISIVHALENRIRLNFSEPPIQQEALEKHIVNLNGVVACSYSDISKNALITFESQEIELLTIIKEVVMVLSSQYCMRHVIIRVRDTMNFTPLSMLSLVSIGSAYLLRASKFFSNHPSNPLYYWEYGAAIITAFAVLEHAAIEVNKTGIFDPEAFSILYLVNQINGKHPLNGAKWTWLASFGRHLFPIASTNHLTIKVIEGVDYKSGNVYNDVVVTGSLSLLDHEKRNKSFTNIELIRGVFKRYKQSQIYSKKKNKLI